MNKNTYVLFYILHKIGRGCLIVLLFAFVTQVEAKEKHIHFNRMDVNNGLSSNEINCVYKDRKGFMWFGTGAGLTRFDGYEFCTFRHEIDNELFSEEYINKITETSDGNLWITYQDGKISVYNPLKNRFSTIETVDSLLSDSGITTVFHDNEGQLLFSTQTNELRRYNFSTGERIAYPVDSVYGKISDAGRYGDTLYVIHCSGVIEIVDVTLNKCVGRDAHLATSSTSRRFKLFIDSTGELWIYYLDPENHNGLFRFTPLTHQWTHYTTTSTLPLTSSLIRSVEEDIDGCIWVATDHGGINLIDKRDETVAYLKNDPFDTRSISQNSVICLYKDNTGIMWCGTYKNGINYYHESIFKFKTIRYHILISDDAGINDYNCVHEDSIGNLWIGTNGKGLLYYDRAKRHYQRYESHPSQANSLTSDIIICLAGDSKGHLWIGTYIGGLVRFDGHTFTKYPFDNEGQNEQSSSSIYSLYADENNTLWVGTLGNGLKCLDLATNRWTHFNVSNTDGELLSDNIYSLSKGNEHELLIGTTLGVNMLDTRTRRITSFRGTKDGRITFQKKSINTAFIDSRHLLWIGSNNGLSVYDAKNDTLYYLDKTSGLPTNDIMSVLEDDAQSLWFGTKNGLLKIVPQYSHLSSAYRFPCTTYYEDEGIQGRIFNRNSTFKTSTTDELIFGGTHGLTIFDPSKIQYNTYPPEIVITGFWLQNKRILPGDTYQGNVILPYDICYLDNISLDYRARNFTFSVSALNYFLPNKNTFAYRMDGFDTEWTYMNATNRSITYTNLPTGMYTFIVKAENNDGVSSLQPVRLHITVSPPFWFAPWFVFLYVCAGLGAVYGTIKIMIRIQKRKLEKEQQRITLNRLYEIDEMKLRFFTNVSHEFRTPLTLIIAPLEKCMKIESNHVIQQMLKLVYENANQLLHLVNQLLDFRKIDGQGASLLLSSGDIVMFVRNITYSFKDISEQKSIHFSYESALPALTIRFDADKIFKIVSNLLSNAFKFTPEGGEIAITLKIEKKDEKTSLLLIHVADTGIGVAQEEYELIFHRFYQSPSNDKALVGTGIGLHLCREFAKIHNGSVTVRSEKGKGSVFTLSIPMETENIREIISSPEPSGAAEEAADDNTLEQDLPVLLMVDDSANFRAFMKQSMQDIYTILTAPDGMEAWQMIVEKLPDIIVSDVMMPVMDGITLCKYVKEDRRTSHIPVILLTAKSAETNKLTGLEAGADDYIGKPFNMDILLLKIQHLIELRKRIQKQILQSMPNGLQLCNASISSLDEELLKKAVHFIEEHISDPSLSVEWLSREMCMSRTNFYKKILFVTGKSPVELIRIIRMKHAARLLEKGRMRVSEVAMQVGFNDNKLFRKYFKEEFGVLPSDYVEHTQTAPLIQSI
jgi:signal transduction histidine kinase/ligand-binding sensor domain-containing protein/AraC-like DNA-binding protein